MLFVEVVVPALDGTLAKAILLVVSIVCGVRAIVFLVKIAEEPCESALEFRFFVVICGTADVVTDATGE